MAHTKLVENETIEMQVPPSFDKPPANIVEPPCDSHPSHTNPVDCGPPPETKTHSKQPVYKHPISAASLSCLTPTHLPPVNCNGNHDQTQQKTRDIEIPPATTPGLQATMMETSGNLSEHDHQVSFPHFMFL